MLFMEDKKNMDENKTMNCPSCGTELPEGTPFCHECGMRLDEEIPQPMPMPGPVPPMPGEVPPPAPPAPENQPIPEPENKDETKQEKRTREKAEKEAEKKQAKMDKAQAKAEKKAERRAERRKRNIWAIFLMIIFFAGMCYIGWEYIGQLSGNRELQNINAGLEQTIADLKSDIEARDKTIADNAEQYTAAEGDYSDTIKDLNSKLDACQEKIDELQKTAGKAQEKADEADDLIEALDSDNIGFASDDFYSDHGIVVMKRSSKGYDVVLTHEGDFEVECVSGTSAAAEVSESNEDVIIFTPKEYGVSVFEVTGENKGEELHIVVIVE